VNGYEVTDFGILNLQSRIYAVIVVTVAVIIIVIAIHHHHLLQELKEIT
jgi:hypothetical protein